jgi:peptidoglycan/xylan/chitin deacetylase (PgdA/CDA1 family)
VKQLLAQCIFAVVGLLFVTSVSLNAQSQREIAITVDDLPASAADHMSSSEILDMTTKLLTTLRDQKIPAVGFVNEKKLYKPGEVDDRIKSLSMWLDYGFELGNHTYSHASLNRVGLKAWEEEIVRGETVTRMLLAQHKMQLRYFRHPYLDVGRDLETRRQAEAFLVDRGYLIAPITMDAWDWAYAGVYDDARRRGDTALQQQLVSSYFSYTTAVFDYYEKFSKDLLGYEPKQIILLHGNWLEADHIGELFDRLRKRGYKFISLQDALSDAAYSLPDEFVGEEGTNWIDHWAITRGHPPQNTPVFPQWVIDRSNALRPPQTQP